MKISDGCTKEEFLLFYTLLTLDGLKKKGFIEGGYSVNDYDGSMSEAVSRGLDMWGEPTIEETAWAIQMIQNDLEQRY